MAERLHLAEAEGALAALLGKGEEEGWPAMAALLQQVDAGELWRERAELRSFSAWVRAFAARVGCSESLLWKYKKAAVYWDRLRAEAPDLPDLADAGTSARNIATVEKIAGADGRQGADLARRVVAGEVAQRDLADMWRATRKVAGARKSRHDAAAAEDARAERGGDAAATLALTRALAREAERWIWGAEDAEEADRRRRENAAREYMTRDAHLVRVLTEFPVRVAEAADRARRVDVAAVCVENQTTDDWMDVSLRGVEVKVSARDLERDEKMGDYGLYLDFMSVAVPREIVPEAAAAVPEAWGVIAWDHETDGVEVVREAERLEAPRREQALATACVKLGCGD